MAKNDGGPAFPGQGLPMNRVDGANVQGMVQIWPQVTTQHYPGMSLRDWFAGQALGLIPFDPYDHASAMISAIPSLPLTEEQHAMIMAKRAYLVADAMLSERNK